MAEHSLPPGVPPGGPDIGDDPAGAERAALAMLRQAGDEMVHRVEAVLPAWAARQVDRLVGAWGGHDDAEATRIVEQAHEAGQEAAVRVGRELDDLFAADPEAQRATPLQVVRSAHREVGEVLRHAGIPPVVRDEFAERSEPGDDYGLVPESFGDLDPELVPLHLAWGVAKATVHKARRQLR